MALSNDARNKIKTLVQKAKKLLLEEFGSQLSQHFGILPNGTVEELDRLASKDPEVIHTAGLLRERLQLIKENILDAQIRNEEGVAQLLREQAFTVLNRMASLRMAEERGIIYETIRKGYESEGFQVYDSLTGKAKTAEIFQRYKWYYLAILDELAIDLPSLFDRYSPFGLLFPSEKALLELLELLNATDLSIHREEGQTPINLWQEDETIGWIYQYYNSREEISAMRDASSAPRNSRELAVRNQFFTPRYVVQFLVDNSLGRHWYEMTKGDTELKELTYLVKQKQELFLDPGESIPQEQEEGVDYIGYRELKDPREITMLDPACGSMHFGLYCFDLYEKIYIETWDRYPKLMVDLRDQYSRSEFIKQIPGLILRHNIHGVDIDPRAIQIAGLSLWLRCQRTFQKLGLDAKDRPRITKSNLVVAEPLPGNKEWLSEVVKPLEPPMRTLILNIWDKMKLAGELGLLLKIEEEIDLEIQKIGKELEEDIEKAQLGIGASTEESKEAQLAANIASKKYREEFLETAEEEVLKNLKLLSEEGGQNGNSYSILLFVEDSVRGFSFIELCRSQFDVIVMNPPFGEPSVGTKETIYQDYPFSKQDIYATFVDRSLQNLIRKNGYLGSITNRNGFFLQKLYDWRVRFINNHLLICCDLGSSIMDGAAVSAMAYVLSRKLRNDTLDFIRLINSDNKESWLIDTIVQKLQSDLLFRHERNAFTKIPFNPFCYWGSKEFLRVFSDHKQFNPVFGKVYQGIATGDNFRFLRLRWEILPENIDKFYKNYFKGGGAHDYYFESFLIINWRNDGKEIKALASQKYGSASRTIKNEDKFGEKGLTYTQVSSSGVMARPLSKNGIFDMKGPYVNSTIDIYALLAIFNSKPFSILTYFLTDTRQLHPTVLNKVPMPNLDDDSILELSMLGKELLEEIALKFSNDERSLVFSPCYKEYVSTKVVDLRRRIDLIVSKLYGIEIREFAEFDYLFTSNKEEVRYSEITRQMSTVALFSYIFGLVVGRYKPKSDNLDNFDFFQFYSKNIQEAELRKLNDIYHFDYSKFNSDFEQAFNACKYEGIINTNFFDFLDQLESESPAFFLENSFFDFHLNHFSESKRLAPIYWQLSTSSGKFQTWIYYPKMDDQTLFRIINSLVEPKIEDVQKEIHQLQEEGGKTYQETKEFLHELQDFREELLKVAQLPYKPNHDDGVLITAAPLHNVFRHTKWKKATQDCWKKLEKGEYDWAHLAYSIWPDRVREKCKKDLSMAIAHGLEDICEVKPKEPRKVKAKGQKVKDEQLKI